MDYSDQHQAEWALQNPATPGEELAAIAQAHPALRDRVVTHPNAYPQLVTWVAAQSTSAASASTPQSGGGPSYGPAVSQPYGHGPAQPDAPGQLPYGQAQPYPAQPYPGQATAPGQQPYGYPAGPPAKKKTGLVLGLVGGGVVAVVAVVAVLGLVVFHWFGGSSGSGPTLTKAQVETFLDSDFMQELSGDTADDYHHSQLSRSDLDISDSGCENLADVIVDADNWTSTVSVTRFVKAVSPDVLEKAADGCSSLDDLDLSAVRDQDGGWWAKNDDSGAITFSHGNVWLDVRDAGGDSDDEIQDTYDNFAAAVEAAAK